MAGRFTLRLTARDCFMLHRALILAKTHAREGDAYAQYERLRGIVSRGLEKVRERDRVDRGITDIGKAMDAAIDTQYERIRPPAPDKETS